MTYSVSYESVTFSIPCESIEFFSSSFGLEGIVQGTHPSIILQNTLEFLQENSLITGLNLDEQHFVFWVKDGIAK